MARNRTNISAGTGIKSCRRKETETPMPLWLAAQPLVLASKSDVRRNILQAAGLPVEVKPAAIDERAVEARNHAKTPGDMALLLAREKARAVATLMPGRLVLGADQTLVLGQRRFSKPADRAAACDQLKALAGKTHELHSAVAVVRNDATLFEQSAVARLTMRAFSDRFLEYYLDAAGEAATTSVGGYQLEGAGIHLFERIEGDYFTILGLPLMPLLQFLRRERFVAE
jgi:septum formation protein